MTDDEINRRVAEIEGWHANNSDYPSVCWWFRGDEKHRGGPPPFATDWAWCGPLINRLLWDGWSIEYREREQSFVLWLPRHQEDAPGPDAINDCALERAICLAIIAAHEDKPSGVWTGLGDK